MKKILFVLFAFIAITTKAQDHKEEFRVNFMKADSAFNSVCSIKADLNKLSNDSTLLEASLDIIESAANETFPIRGDQFLLMYWSGYIDGSVSFKKRGSFDYKYLIKTLKVNRKAMRSYQRFLKQLKE